MTTDADHPQDVIRAVARMRERGDAHARTGDPGATELYGLALNRIDRFLDELDATGTTPSHDEMAEIHGVRGGLLRRLDRPQDALASYRAGADQEREGNLASTYNRVNAIKLALQTGDDTVAGLRPLIADAESALSRSVRGAQEDGWLWADLGDLRLLLGNLDDAKSAYRIYADKAATGAPAKTLRVLDDLGQALQVNKDPDAEHMSGLIDRVRPVLSQ